MSKTFKVYFPLPESRSEQRDKVKAIIEALREAGLTEEADKAFRSAVGQFPGRMIKTGIQCKSYKKTRRYVRWSKEADFAGEYRWEVCRMMRVVGIPMNEIENAHRGYGRMKDAREAALKFAEEN